MREAPWALLGQRAGQDRLMFDVTLTFDNGPEPETTPAVLDALARESIRATFFVLGHKIADPRRRALAERAAREGHWIGNHTYSHETPLGELAGAAVPQAEIGRTQDLIADLCHPDKLFRPFGGGGIIGRHLLSPAALRYLKAGGYSCVLWNVIPRDFDDAQTWPERALDLMQPLAWALVVLHDLPGGAMAHLDRFTAMVRAAGGCFRQDFPPDCVPLRGGREVRPMSGYVANEEVPTLQVQARVREARARHP